MWRLVLTVDVPGGNEDDEPDKMAIAFGRFGTFKRFLGRSIKNFFVFLKNKIVEMVSIVKYIFIKIGNKIFYLTQISKIIRCKQ